MIRRFAPAAALTLLLAQPAQGQWTATWEQFYYPARDNWVFRTRYPAADRLFNAFDYGHAILYELLHTRPGADPGILEEREYDRLTRQLLVTPPRLPLREMAIMPHYTRLAPEAKQMFEWAHILHRQVYDVLADERLGDAAREARMRELLRYYRSRPDLAFSERPKTMALMQEQYYSLAFREGYPKFNGLIWGYHWLQVGLYEPLVTGRSLAERQAGVSAAVARFRQMLTDAPRTLPYQMPMTSAIAPEFSRRYPELAIIFDNLHSMHDVISDILASERVPRARKRAEILRAAVRYRDDTTEVMSVEGWRRMSAMMGLDNMGGPAVGFVAALPTPTVPRGYVMRHDRDGNMLGDGHAGHAAPDPHAAHDRRDDKPPADPHAGHAMPAATTDADSVQGVVRAFHAALDRGDRAGVTVRLAPEALVQVNGDAQPASAYIGGSLDEELARAVALDARRSAYVVRVDGELATVSSTVSLAGTYRGRRVAERGEELLVLRRRDGTWSIVSLHRSLRDTAPGER